MRLFSKGCLSLLVFAGLFGSAAAHPFHVSIAEAEFKPQTGMLEVSLRVHPSDLETALRKQTREPVVLETSPNVDEQILAYLRRAFVVKTAEGNAAEIRWIGKEVSVKHAWLYFEIPLKDGLPGAEFSQRLFFELLPDQVNTINFRQGQRQATLHFTRAEPVKRFAWTSRSVQKP